MKGVITGGHYKQPQIIMKLISLKCIIVISKLTLETENGTVQLLDYLPLEEWFLTI